MLMVITDTAEIVAVLAIPTVDFISGAARSLLEGGVVVGVL